MLTVEMMTTISLPSIMTTTVTDYGWSSCAAAAEEGRRTSHKSIDNHQFFLLLAYDVDAD
jgi:hypothetical protein